MARINSMGGFGHLTTTFAAVLLALAPISMVRAEDPTDAAPVITKHHAVVAGKRLDYEAEAGRQPILDAASGRTVAHIFYVAYRVPGTSGRPLTVMWNGGPGLPAASVHFEGFGPRRIEAGALIDNNDTLLTESDLIFVDPVGTGFSRAVDEDALQAFLTTVGDFDAAIEFVRAYLIAHDDEDRPLILSGQSFAAGRAGTAAYGLLKRGFNVRAIALVSNTQGLPRYPDQSLIAPAVHVADYAVAALYFKKLPPELGTTPDSARQIAEKWVHETYLPALRRIDRLSVSERDTIAAELARRTGLKSGDIDRNSLLIGQGFFLGHIADGRLPYYSDYRYFEPYTKPSLAEGIAYLRQELGWRSPLPYLPEEPVETGFVAFGKVPQSINSRWRATTVHDATDAQIAAARAEFAKRGVIGAGRFGPDLPGAAEAIELSPKLRVLVQHGAYDPLGGCSIDAELARQLEGRAREAVRVRCYLAGHAIYRDAPARAAYAEDMRALAREIMEYP